MRFPHARTVLTVLVGATVLSCSDTLTAVKRPSAATLRSNDATAAPAKPQLVISQVYGGGGNSGATYTNDFVELFNPTGVAVTTTGWSVQYASANGTTWQVSPLKTATIPPGGYYLVMESKGSGGTTPLPAPYDSTKLLIAMSATDGKIALVNSATPLSGACPTNAVDIMTFGTVNTTTGCSLPAGTAKLSNTTAALRTSGGCDFTGVPNTDFAIAAPAPRNSATPVHVCPGTLPLGPLDHLTISAPANPTVLVGATLQLMATPQDANNQTVGAATVSWKSSNDKLATIDNTGLVTGVSAGTGSVTFTATATSDNITKTATIDVAVKNPGINWIDVSSSSTSFPPGFQTQLFLTARVAQNGQVVDADFTIEPLDPLIATVAMVDNTGIITGVAPQNGTTKPGFKITAVPKGGGDAYTFTSHPLTIETPAFSPASIYATNDEFGDPTPASKDNANDLLIRRNQYVLSYNESRGTPNWVSYELDSRQFGGEDRCNCFTADPTLPSDKQILTSDYTNGGYDRGHMARSADRTTTNGDNATTFYLTNIVPQQGDLNQGVWAQFENALGDSAKAGRAVYIITGPLYTQGKTLAFLKDSGKVAIPDSTWKVALIGPVTGGNPFTRGSVQTWSDVANLTILAVNMPNIAGVRNDPWQKYLTTVDKIERSTGYDFLSLLQTAFQDALEAGDHAPVARFATTGTPNEGSAITFDASTSTDADLGRTDLGRTEALSYQWQFSDGVTATGKTVTRTFTHFGSFTATLTVTDAFGWPATLSQTVTVNDVAPAVYALPNALLITGEAYNASGTFGDAGLDAWTGSVDYGDGSGASTLALTGKTFSLFHVYQSAGVFYPTVTVTDDGGLAGSRTATVTVETPLTATQRLASHVQSDAAHGDLVAQEANPLQASLEAAEKQMGRGNNLPAMNELGAFMNKVNAAAMTGRISPDAAQDLLSLAGRIQRALATF